MREYLLIKLQGPMQAWGTHSFEGLRPSGYFPSRSAVQGLLSACLGIRRHQRQQLESLGSAVHLAVRIDRRTVQEGDRPLVHQSLTDYHTVQGARVEYSGLKSHETIQTWREYLTDAEFTLALWLKGDEGWSLDLLDQAIRQPRFTPYLGRRSCPIGRPLFAGRVQALDEFEALRLIEPQGGTVYSETRVGDPRALKTRDVPLAHQPRQFASRLVYEYGGKHVPE